MPSHPGNDCPIGPLATGGYWRAMSQENVERRLPPSHAGEVGGEVRAVRLD